MGLEEEARMRLPDVFGLILCNRLDVNPQVGQTSLQGIFQALSFSTFPSPTRPFTAYAALFDGEGEGTMELVIARLETEQDIHHYSRWVTLPGRGLVMNLEIPIESCVFPAPGRYVLVLRFDKSPVAYRFLEIIRREV